MNRSNYLVLAILSLVWGSSFILIKKALVSFTPVQVVSLRLGIAAIAFLPIFITQLHKIEKTRYIYLLFIGFLGSFFPFLLYATGQTQISSSVAGVLNSLTPLFTFTIGILFFRNPLRTNKIIGVMLGLFGAISLLALSRSSSLEGNPLFGLLIISATICYAFTSHIVAHFLRNMNPLLISAASFVMVGIPAISILWITKISQVFMNDPHAWSSLGYIALLSLFGTIFATILYFQLIHNAGAVFSSYVAYLMPLVAVLWGIADGEHFGWHHLLGMSLILLGIYIGRNRLAKSKIT